MSAMAHGIPLIVDSAKRDLNSVIEWGRQKMQEGAFEAAVQHFTAALDLKPGLMQALVSRGFCHLTLGEEDKAQKDFAEVITKDAGFNRNIYVLIALCLKRSGDYHKAIRYLTRCIGQFASFKPALIARGELSLKVQEFDKARMDFRQVLNNSPADLVARRGLADALRGLGNFREALRQYSRAIQDAAELLARYKAREEDTPEGGSEGSLNGSQVAGEGGGPSASSRGSEANGDGSSSGASIMEVSASRRARATGAGEGSGEGGDSDVGGLVPDGPESEVLKDELASDPSRLREFLVETLLRRALLLRLIGDLEAASESLLEVLQIDIHNGLILFWYGKLLLEQNRHKEAPGFLQASIQHHPETRANAHALLGALQMTAAHVVPDCEAALRNLREAAALEPASQPIKVTLWICTAMSMLREAPRDPETALYYLDRALHALSAPAPAPPQGGPPPPAGSTTPRPSPASPQKSGGTGAKIGLTPRVHVAGSGGAAAAALALGAHGKSPEETRWTATKVLVRRRQELAKGGDLGMALECRSYLQLVAEDPQQRVAEVPFLLYMLRTVALCDLCRWEEAVSDCRKALAIDPKDETAQYTLHIATGILRAKCLKYEAAVSCFSKAIRIRPVSSEARIHRAIALARAARAAGAGGAGGAQSPREAGTLNGGSVAGGGPPRRAGELLEEAVQDLEAVEQQAQITGAVAPIGAGHLRAACLCSLGRAEDAHEVLQRCRDDFHQGGSEAMARQSALEAEVLILLGQYHDAIEACTAMLAAGPADSPMHVEARLMRGCCYSELGDADHAFEDYREALVLAPDRADVHEASGELFLLHRCYAEAVTAFGTAARLADALSPRITYKRALAFVALGNPAAALKDMNKALRLNPHIPTAARARDGVAALQAAIDGDFQRAHVRFNVLLHAPAPPIGSPERLPALLLPHEIAVYRGVCSLYLGEAAAAIQDFGAAVELAHQVLLSSLPPGGAELLAEHSAGGPSVGGSSPSRAGASRLSSCETEAPRHLRLPPEVSSQLGLDCFACEAQYNIAVCQLLARQYASALSTCQHLLDCQDALRHLGPQAVCLAWFLVGVCNLALGEASDAVAREAFTQSYAHDPRYVDDFLRRHGRRHDAAIGMGHGVSPMEPPSRGSPVPNPAPRGGGRVGGPYRPPPGGGGAAAAGGGGASGGGSLSAGSGPSRPPGACDAVPEAICCLRAEKSRLSAKLPPLKIQVRDVVIWVRPSAAWPAVRPSGPLPPAGLARLDLLQQHEAVPAASASSPSPVPGSGGPGGDGGG